MIWPTPYAMTTTLQLGGETGSRLTLPLVPPSMYAAPQFASPEPSQERSDIQGGVILGPANGRPSATKLMPKQK